MLPLHYMRARNPKDWEGRTLFAATAAAKEMQLLHTTGEADAPR